MPVRANEEECEFCPTRLLSKPLARLNESTREAIHEAQMADSDRCEVVRQFLRRTEHHNWCSVVSQMQQRQLATDPTGQTSAWDRFYHTSMLLKSNSYCMPVFSRDNRISGINNKLMLHLSDLRINRHTLWLGNRRYYDTWHTVSFDGNDWDDPPRVKQWSCFKLGLDATIGVFPLLYHTHLDTLDFTMCLLLAASEYHLFYIAFQDGWIMESRKCRMEERRGEEVPEVPNNLEMEFLGADIDSQLIDFYSPTFQYIFSEEVAGSSRTPSAIDFDITNSQTGLRLNATVFGFDDGAIEYRQHRVPEPETIDSIKVDKLDDEILDIKLMPNRNQFLVSSKSRHRLLTLYDIRMTNRHSLGRHNSISVVPFDTSHTEDLHPGINLVPKHQLLIGSSTDSVVRFWDLLSGRLVHAWDEHNYHESNLDIARKVEVPSKPSADCQAYFAEDFIFGSHRPPPMDAFFIWKGTTLYTYTYQDLEEYFQLQTSIYT